jgi:hypothetical protein
MRERKARGWRRAARWGRNLVFGLIGLVAFVVITAYVVFETRWGKDVLRSQIETRMAKVFIGGATLGGVEGNPLTELVLTDLVINGPDGEQAIAVKRLTVKVPILPLISSELRVAKVLAEDLDIHVKHTDDGELNLANLTKPTEDESTWSIKLPDVQVRRGHVRIEDVTPEPVDLDNIELSIDAALPFAGPIEASLSLTADWRQREAPLALSAAFYDDDAVTAVPLLVAQVGDIDVALFGVRSPKDAFQRTFQGTVVAYAPADQLHALVPAVELPGDAALTLTATPDGRLTRVSGAGAVGSGRFGVVARADVQAKLASGVIMADRLDLDQLTGGTLSGDGGMVASFDVDANDPAAELPSVNALATAWGNVDKASPTRAVISLVMGGNRIETAVVATSAAGMRATIAASVYKDGDLLRLEHGLVVAATQDLRRGTHGLAPVRGALDANLQASGTLSPELDLEIRGHADARRLRMNDIRARTVAFRIDGKNIPSDPVGTARLEAVGLRAGDLELGKLTLAAGTRPDGKLQVSVRSRPKQAPWLIDLDAVVTTGKTVVVDLQRHFVRAGGGAVWRGDTGVVRVGPTQIELREFASNSRDGRIAAAGHFVREGRNAGDLEAKLDASLDLGSLEHAYRGKVKASVDVSRKRGRLAGNVTAKATGIALDPNTPITLDADARIAAGPDQVRADIALSTLEAGDARVVVDIASPKDITDTRAWSKLGRDAVRTASVELDGLDLGQLARVVKAGPMAGRVDGQLQLTADEATGTIKIRGVQVPRTRGLGRIHADLQLTQTAPDQLKTALTARLQPDARATAAREITRDGGARLYADAELALPHRLFDPDAWRALGANAFQGGALRAERLAFEPGTLERFGIVSDLRGELSVGAELEKGLGTARFAVNLYNLRGGVLAKPVSMSVAGVIDGDAARIIASVHARNITLVRMASEIPVSLDQLRSDPDAVKRAKLSATVTIPQIPARTLMSVLGTTQITGGVLDGKIDVAGTVGKPTVDARIVACGVTVPAESGEPMQQIEELTIVANWDGTRGKVSIDGTQSAGGTLKLRAAGSPDDLAAVTASLDANKLDIAPLVAFMPGPAGGLGGRMEAAFRVRGADPATADLSGSLRIRNGRIPISPAIGTLFKGDVRVDIKNKVVDLGVSGKLGRGDLKLRATAPLDGATPRSGNLRLEVDKVQLISTVQPIISGAVVADIARVDEQWRANVRVDGMTVEVPSDRGRPLSPVGAPNDIVYGGVKIHHGEHKGKDAPKGNLREAEAEVQPPTHVEGPVARRRSPDEPVVDARITIRNVFVESNELRGLVGGNLRVQVGQDSEIGMIGQVRLTRGVLDLFNRRYQVDKAHVHFDGSLDPVVDVRIVHDFPEVTTITEVRGRSSDPELNLTSNPAQYSQAELLGFLLGGEPGGDPRNAPSATERVAGAGASFIGNKVGGYVKEALPIDIDVLRYEAASSTSSAAVTVGTWLTDSVFLAYRRRLEARPNENAGEGEIEYWIRRRLVLEGIAGDRGVNGVDLLWRRRW